MSIKYALFDFDGTLVDSNEAVISMLHLAAVEHRGIPFNEVELDEILGKPIKEQMAYLSEEKADELVAFFRIEYRKVRDELTRSYEGIEAMLLQLKSLGIKTGVVSNKGRDGIDHGMDMFKLHDLIDVTISKDDVEKTKPDPEGIFKALEQLGADSGSISETVFIGDSGHDIESGKRAGCKTILVGWTLINREKLLPLNPDCIAETPMEILEFIKEN